MLETVSGSSDTASHVISHSEQKINPGSLQDTSDVFNPTWTEKNLDESEGNTVSSSHKVFCALQTRPEAAAQFRALARTLQFNLSDLLC